MNLLCKMGFHKRRGPADLTQAGHGINCIRCSELPFKEQERRVRNDFSVLIPPMLQLQDEVAELTRKLMVSQRVGSALSGSFGRVLKERDELYAKSKLSIELAPAEIQSGVSRVKWAEDLIRQLPETHEGRNSWLLNYGTKSNEC